MIVLRFGIPVLPGPRVDQEKAHTTHVRPQTPRAAYRGVHIRRQSRVETILSNPRVRPVRAELGQNGENLKGTFLPHHSFATFWVPSAREEDILRPV